MYGIIRKKRDGGELTAEEIYSVIDGYVKGEIKDYQMSALCMAIFYKGMTAEETAILTDAMAKSGDTLDLSELGEKTVDKHSTGGVGDKTTLIVAPIVASLGAITAKMSGRGLGHTGGTVDKLEAIPGYKTEMLADEFMLTAKKIGIAVVGQSKNLAPADKMLYGLRDVTATVDSMPLIASSIMSKKLAAGAHSIVLDVKVGSGAFMKTVREARELAEAMIAIGRHHGRNVRTVLSNMDEPLGFGIGNMIEVGEALDVLRGNGPEDLREVCITLASEMLSAVYDWEREESRNKAAYALSSGMALQKFNEWITAQGGDVSAIDRNDKCEFCEDITIKQSGFIAHINAEKVGDCCVLLGAGRADKNDSIDHAAGIVLKKKVGEYVEAGDTIAVIYTNKADCTAKVTEMLIDSYTIADKSAEKKPIIIDIIS